MPIQRVPALDLPHDASHTAPPIPCLGYFQKRIQAAHFQTLSTSPTILHWDSETGDLAPWKWPVDVTTGYRVTPSELEAHRRTHYFLAPSCLCARLFNESYSESRIGLVHVPIKLTPTSTLNGEYTAECASGRCGYLVCLERFYVLPVLHVKGYLKREIPLPPCTVNYNSSPSPEILRGLQQVMPTECVQSRGIKRFRVDEPYSNGHAVHRALALVQEGMTKDVLYNLKLKFQHTELDVTHPIHRSARPPSQRTPRTEDDLSTDVETDEDIESDEEVDELILVD
ncbi:hypothetical protein BKA70DRAFT_1421818 [Coprinopsis sp. MPI-PUGE-AT-0042]|nr:hypothetical protein BKA70DRAFT_1421818 [Coprinopsis sp. MPI-PUGE-AT-0042]